MASKSSALDRDIAVVGMACRFPGAENYNVFWKNLSAGVSSISEVPADRWDWRSYWGNPETDANKTDCKWGGFIDRPYRFDAGFFKITPRECSLMDPQQRIMLELAWACLEDAGYAPLTFSKFATGVFIGVCNFDYKEILDRSARDIEGYFLTGSLSSMVPNRISQFFDFHGPSLSIDTACASSLFALDQAIKAIHAGECAAALAGGVNLLLCPERFIPFSQLGMVTKRGGCRAFDADADGYVRAEGAGLVLLKTLRQARRDGDRILGLIKRCEVNHGGRVRNLTSPNAYAQSRLIVQACTAAGIPPETITYLEAHGTGTALGDPIEINGLKRAFAHLHRATQRPVPEKPYCGIGTVKSNIGHLEGAAGIAGVIKTLLCLQHKQLAPLASFRQINPKIDLERSPFYLVDTLREWGSVPDEKGRELPRRAGVSSFGIGGSNAHVILEEHKENDSPGRKVRRRGPALVVLSASNEDRLQASARHLLAFINENHGLDLDDIAHTLQAGRQPMAERLALVVCDLRALQAGLESFCAGSKDQNGMYLGRVDSQSQPWKSLTGGKAGRQIIQAAVREKDLETLAACWVSGAEWTDTITPKSGKPRRLALPTYPFAGEQYGGRENFGPVNQSKAGLHGEPGMLARSGVEDSTVSEPVEKEQGPANGASPDGGGLKTSEPLITFPQGDFLDLESVSGVAVEPGPMAAESVFTPESDPAIPRVRLKRLSGPAALAGPLVSTARPTEARVPASPTGNRAKAVLSSEELELKIRSLVASVMYLNERKVERDKKFADLGLDSILGVEIARKISAEFGINFSAAILYDHPCVRELAAHLGRVLGGQASEKEGADARFFAPVPPPNFVAGGRVEESNRPEQVEKEIRPIPPPSPRPEHQPSPPAAVKPRPGFEPVAIVGLAGRFPGARDAGSFWENLWQGKCSIGALPEERWPGVESGRDAGWMHGGFLEGVDEFDPAFFEMARAEAEQVDPQHRLFFQEAWKALEDAGYSSKDVSGDRCGLFVGVLPSEYFFGILDPEAHALPGNFGSGLTGRLAYFLDWRGPCLAVDAACASSFSALHLACASLARRECDLALGGGVHVATGPKVFTATHRMGLLSSSGQCRAFNASADGWVIGEAVGAVVMKRLDDAVRDGDRVYAVIRGCAMNQDGSKNGFTAPKASAQTALQTAVFNLAGIEPSEIDYVELHGMSSLLGDEVEVLALRESFASVKSGMPRCALGSLKPNIGHPMAAAGIASVIKVALALRHQKLPPLIGLDRANEALGLEPGPFYFNTAAREWVKPDGRPRRAAINGLSATGVNSHFVLEEFVASDDVDFESGEVRGPTDLILLSARDGGRLREVAGNLAAYLEEHSEARLGEVAFTLQTGRKAFEERFALVARSVGELKRDLNAFARGERPAGVFHQRIDPSSDTLEAVIGGERGGHFIDAAIRNRDWEKVARLWAAGLEIDWRPLYPARPPRRLSLPTYPFARGRYWISEPELLNSTAAAKSTRSGESPAFAVTGRANGSTGDTTLEILTKIIAGVLRCRREDVAPDADLFQAGFNSLYAIRVANGFESTTGATIPARRFFEARSIRKLSALLDEDPVFIAARSRNGGRTPTHDADRVRNLDERVMSEGEQALWSIQTERPLNTAYNLPLAWRWNEPFDHAALAAVLTKNERERPGLRSVFPFEGGGPVRRVRDRSGVELSRVDLRGLDHAAILRQLEEWARQPFDLEKGPLWRVWAVTTGQTEGILLLVFHHLIIDGHGFGSLLEELESDYERVRRGGSLEAPVEDPGMARFVAAEKAYLASEAARADREYWLKSFPQGFPALKLPEMKPRFEGDLSHGGLLTTTIPAAMVESLDRVAAVRSITLQSVFLSAYLALLIRESGQDNVSIGLIADARPPGCEEICGFLVNLIPVRVSAPVSNSLGDLMDQTFSGLMEALDHRRFPFRLLARALAHRGGAGGQHELDAAFYFQRWATSIQRSIASRLVPGIYQAGEFDLVFDVSESGADWLLHAKYRPSTFTGEYIARLSARYVELLEEITADTAHPVVRGKGMAALDGESKLFQYPRRGVHQLISEQAGRTPSAVAVIFKDRLLSYAEIEAQSNRVANYLVRLGVKPGDLVAVLLDRSAEMLACLMGVWKAGAAYIPLDPNYPQERIGYILEDAQARIILTEASVAWKAPQGVRAVFIDRERRSIELESSEAPGISCLPNSLAYVIYTSGSTGQPKGVRIGHGSLAHFLWCMAERPGCSPRDQMLAVTTICFDIAALELFLPLVTGARVEILPEPVARSGARLREKVENSGATIVQGTPATWRMLIAAGLGTVPRVKSLCGGEAWDQALAGELLARCGEVWNMYGPTETTVWSSVQRVEANQPVRLGEPVGNTRFYVLDEQMRPVPSGGVGELFIGGDGLAQGYLNRPELTNERFVRHPLRPEEVIYRTGDLVSYV